MVLGQNSSLRKVLAYLFHYMLFRQDSIQRRSAQNIVDIFYILTLKEIKIRYKTKYLGYLWSLLNPLFFSAIYFAVFSIVMRVKIENYPLFLITSLFLWQWVNNSIGVSPSIFLGNGSLVKKVNFPRNVLPLVVVAQDAFHFVLTIPLIFMLKFYYGSPLFMDQLWFMPLLILTTFVFLYGCSLLISTINVFFRDMDHIIKLALTFSMYLTPIMYSETMIPEKYVHLIYFNPFAMLVIAWRDVALSGVVHLDYFLVFLGFTAFVNLIAHLMYQKLQSKFAEVM